MAEREKPYLHSSGRGMNWDWWRENPVEIILVVFILVLFFFFESLPPQGWGIDAGGGHPVARGSAEP